VLQRVKTSQVNTLVGVSTEITGSLKFVGGLRVEGTIIGDVEGKDRGEAMHEDYMLVGSTLVMTKDSLIRGSVKVRHAEIDGNVLGPISCETLYLKKNARVTGDISYVKIVVEEGAIIYGSLKEPLDWKSPFESSEKKSWFRSHKKNVQKISQ
jgi:cytoskeletal protein CcmA (bactofilin family)